MKQTIYLFTILAVLFSAGCRDDDDDLNSVIDDIVGSYSADEECSTAFFDYTFSIAAASGDRITIANYGDFGVAVSATVSDRFISIDDQTFNVDNVEVTIFNGLGEIDGNTITSNYAYTIDGGDSEICTFTATRI